MLDKYVCTLVLETCICLLETDKKMKVASKDLVSFLTSGLMFTYLGVI